MQLDGKVALVTEAARRVGAEIAVALAHAGCHVAVHYRHSEAEAGETAARIRELGREAVLFRANLEDRDGPGTLVDRAVQAFGGVDLLVNSAAVFHPTPWGDSAPEDWLGALRVNLVAPVMLAQACWPVFRERGGGCVINITDIYADRPMPSYAAYAASKAALTSATKSMARLMAPHVRVNAVAPGVAVFPESYGPRARALTLAKVPMGRAGVPRDIAAAVVFLAGSSDYTSGQTLVVDGGRSAAW